MHSLPLAELESRPVRWFDKLLVELCEVSYQDSPLANAFSSPSLTFLGEVHTFGGLETSAFPKQSESQAERCVCLYYLYFCQVRYISGSLLRRAEGLIG